MIKNISCYKRTSDNWHPSFSVDGEDVVRVHYVNDKRTDTYYISVWGADDYGLEKSFKSMIAAERCLLTILESPRVNIDVLLSAGFKGA